MFCFVVYKTNGVGENNCSTHAFQHIAVVIVMTKQNKTRISTTYRPCLMLITRFYGWKSMHLLYFYKHCYKQNNIVVIYTYDSCCCYCFLFFIKVDLIPGQCCCQFGCLLSCHSSHSGTILIVSFCGCSCCYCLCNKIIMS